MDAVYAADAAAAQEALQAALAEDPDHDFAVRVRAHASVRLGTAPPPPRHERDVTPGFLISTCGDIPKINTTQKSQSLIRAQRGRRAALSGCLWPLMFQPC